ncbi:MAG: trypsin-like peptidase domain-containing protein [Chthoniobacteraceae bacterium]
MNTLLPLTWLSLRLTAAVIAESEFTSIEDARGVEVRLRASADKVAPAVVRLSSGAGSETIHQGSGVVIESSGLILTHGHHGLQAGTQMKAAFPDGKIEDVVIESVFSGQGRDFSLLKILKEGRYPAVPLRGLAPLAVGDRCFHLGYPGRLNEIMPLSTPVLRLGRVAGIGSSSVYANCLIISGDSGGPLFDLDGRLVGVLNVSIGPDLRHPGRWADVSHIVDGTTFLASDDSEEAVKMGFTNRKRDAVDTRRHFVNSLCAELLAPSRRGTVEVLIDGQPVILGTILDATGRVITKRSEIMTHRGILFGRLTCRTFAGEELSAKAIANSVEDDIALLQLPKGGWAAAPLGILSEPGRGVIVVVPVPAMETTETGVVGSLDHAVKIAPCQGSVPLKVKELKTGVTVSTTTRELQEERLIPLIRGTVREGDVITHVDGKATPDLASYEREAKRDTLVSGDYVQLAILRGATTTHAFMPLDSYQGITSHDYADPSLRLSGLPAVFTHDVIVGRRQCGGPVVDLDGRVIGVNIARLDRFSTLAIPPQTLLELARKLSASANTTNMPNE